MGTQHADERIQRDGTGTGVKRRGILAAAGAIVAALLAKQTSQQVAASTAMQIANTETTGVSNAVVGPSTIAAASTFTSPNAILIADAHLAPSSGALAALHGSVNTPSAAPELCGVYGQSTVSFTGVLGQSVSGVGVKGKSTTSTAVQGLIPSTSGAANTKAVWGDNQSTGSGGSGVYGASTGGYGVLGISFKPGFAGLSGITTTTSVPAFAGGSTTPSALAAQFNGGVFIDCTGVGGGNFVVNPMTAKNGLLKHPDGSHRLMYSMEAPESWAEDFGKGQLSGGKAEVRLDPDFAALVETGEYHVFLTPYEGVSALRAARRTASGFAVEEIGGMSNGTFSYRIVARPKSEQKVTRLAKYPLPPPLTMPDIGALTKPVDVPPPPPQPPDAPSPGQPPARPSAPAGVSPAVASPQGGGTPPGTPPSPVPPVPPPRP